MRILYLVYAPQSSLSTFQDKYRTNFPWVDAMLNEMVKVYQLDAGLAVPIDSDTYQKIQKDKITLYGLPNVSAKGFFFRLLNKSKSILQDNEIQYYTQKTVDDFDPDIVQIFGTENIFGNVQLRGNKPVVIHFQGSVLAVSVKWFAGISKLEQLRSLSLKNLIYKKGSYYEYFIFNGRGNREELIMRKCKYFIGRTSFDKKLISLISPEAKYFYCEEFIREDFFRSKWSLPLTESITCVSILKGVTYKGIDLLIDTMTLLAHYSSFKIEFKICGVKENEEVVNILKRKHKNNENMSKIRFLGKLTTNALIDELRSSNFFIHPSYMENSSNSVCEAMALGMPVISTNVGGISSLVQDGVNGVLVQEGEPYSMAAALVELITNYDLAKQLGQNARELSKRRHDPGILRGKMIEIYQAIISDNLRS